MIAFEDAVEVAPAEAERVLSATNGKLNFRSAEGMMANGWRQELGPESE
ncbi:hypothetical protein [Okeania hirsuta]|nr:hypothetical protein [Okeania hirsuta]